MLLPCLELMFWLMHVFLPDLRNGLWLKILRCSLTYCILFLLFPFLSSFLFLYIYVFVNMSALEVSLMQYFYELSLKTGICIEKLILLHRVRESIIWWGYSNQHVLFVKTTPNKCGHIIYWLVGDGRRLLLLLKQHEKSGWSIIVTLQKYHIHNALAARLPFPMQWEMHLGRQGVWWGAPWANKLKGLQGTTSRNMT